MKIKELQRTVNVAWSPAQEHPIYLATGTAAQQLDTNFHSNAALELYNVNLADPSYDMALAATQPSQYKYVNNSTSSYLLSEVTGPTSLLIFCPSPSLSLIPTHSHLPLHHF